MSHDIQLNEPRLKVRENQTYLVTFLARADRPRSLYVGCAQAYPPWSNLGSHHNIELTTEWRKYEEKFVAVADSENARLYFDVGESDSPVELEAVTLRSLSKNVLILPDLPTP